MSRIKAPNGLKTTNWGSFAQSGKGRKNSLSYGAKFPKGRNKKRISLSLLKQQEKQFRLAMFKAKKEGRL